MIYSNKHSYVVKFCELLLGQIPYSPVTQIWFDVRVYSMVYCKEEKSTTLTEETKQQG